MPILRSITLKLKTKLSPTSSPSTSPQDTVSFERLGGRKVTVDDVVAAYTKSEYVVSDDCISTSTKGTSSSMERTEKKDKRRSKFREELDEEH